MQTKDYRWARVEAGIRAIVTKPQLKKALDARIQICRQIPRLALKEKNPLKAQIKEE